MIEFIGLFLALAAVAAAILWIVDLIRKPKTKLRKQRGRAREEQLRREGEAFARWFVERRPMPAIVVPIILQPGEIGLYKEDTTLYESQTQTVHSGGAVEIEGVMVGGLSSSNVERMNRIDGGTLILTSQRLVFNGAMQSRSVELKNILSARAGLYGIEVGTSTLQRSQCFEVENPYTWAGLITGMASRPALVPAQRRA